MTAGDSRSRPEVPRQASRRVASRRVASRARPHAAMAAQGSVITAGLVIGTTQLGEHWQSDVLAVTTRTPGAQPGSKCSQNTVARPPVPTVAASSPESFHAAMATAPAVTVRRCASRGEDAWPGATRR